MIAKSALPFSQHRPNPCAGVREHVLPLRSSPSLPNYRTSDSTHTDAHNSDRNRSYKRMHSATTILLASPLARGLIKLAGPLRLRNISRACAAPGEFDYSAALSALAGLYIHSRCIFRAPDHLGAPIDRHWIIDELSSFFCSTCSQQELLLLSELLRARAAASKMDDCIRVLRCRDSFCDFVAAACAQG